jgi:hypothetical protein
VRGSKILSCCTPSPSLSPKGEEYERERNMREERNVREEGNMKGRLHWGHTRRGR